MNDTETQTNIDMTNKQKNKIKYAVSCRLLHWVNSCTVVAWRENSIKQLLLIVVKEVKRQKLNVQLKINGKELKGCLLSNLMFVAWLIRHLFRN